MYLISGGRLYEPAQSHFIPKGLEKILKRNSNIFKTLLIFLPIYIFLMTRYQEDLSSGVRILGKSIESIPHGSSLF
jgi:hypothetical protein